MQRIHTALHSSGRRGSSTRHSHVNDDLLPAWISGSLPGPAQTTTTTAINTRSVEESDGDDAQFSCGLRVWHDCADAKVDICFVHGLAGDLERTWIGPKQAQPWPKLLLPGRTKDARIMTYGYDAYVAKSGRASNNKLEDHAVNLLSDLTSERLLSTSAQRPIIFVAHSLGGLVCKAAILRSRNHPTRKLRHVFECTKGIIFMGTPHKGSWMASWATIPASVLGIFKSTNRHLLDILETENQLLQSIQVNFWEMMREQREAGRAIEVTCFYEEYGMPGAGHIVTKESATLEGWDAYSIPANHRDMVKFTSENDPGFKRVLGELMGWQSNISAELSVEDREFLEIFSDVRPYDERERILGDKGGLLRDSYTWIINHAEFSRCLDDQEARLLWIHGDPGKGKTMLLCGIVDHLASGPAEKGMSYFFCQKTDRRLDNASAVVRGVIFMLLSKNPHLIPPFRIKYQINAKTIFNGGHANNSWPTLSGLLSEILQHPRLSAAYIIIDALDECSTGQQQLLNLVTQTSSTLPATVKWIVSSRTLHHVAAQFRLAQHVAIDLSLEDNSQHIVRAVGAYIDLKVQKLAQLQEYDAKLQREVKSRLSRGANGTFLWVALVCQTLESTPRFRVLGELEGMPTQLDGLYQTMLQHLTLSPDKGLCIPVLALMTASYGPLGLDELARLVDSELVRAMSAQDLTIIINLCASFLSLHGGRVFFVHQSAKDFLADSVASRDLLFPSGLAKVHQSILSRAIGLMDSRLCYNMFRIAQPGSLVGDVVAPTPKDNPLDAMHYSCVYWLEHACGLIACAPESYAAQFTGRGNALEAFLLRHFLHWLEGLSLLRTALKGIVSMKKLLLHIMPARDTKPQQVPGSKKSRSITRFFDSIKTLAVKQQEEKGAGSFLRFLEDAERFMTKNASIIESAPLQIYGGALAFTPQNNRVRKQFWDQRLPILRAIRGVAEHEDACLQILEGHAGQVNAVIFSYDETLVATASLGSELRIWDISTGSCLQSFDPSCTEAKPLAFSRDNTLLACVADDVVQVWDLKLHTCVQTLHLCSNPPAATCWHTQSARIFPRQTLNPNFVASSDLKQIASSFTDGLRLWDVSTGSSVKLDCSNLDGRLDGGLAFTSTDTMLVSMYSVYYNGGGGDRLLLVWETSSGSQIKQLAVGVDMSHMLFPSHKPDSIMTVSFNRKQVREWNLRTGEKTVMSAPEGPSAVWRSCSDPAFGLSSQGGVIATAEATEMPENPIRLWDFVRGCPAKTLPGHYGAGINAFEFSRTGRLLISSSADGTARVWDVHAAAMTNNARAGSSLQDPPRRAPVTGIASSVDGGVVAFLLGHKPWVWDTNAAPGPRNPRRLFAQGVEHGSWEDMVSQSEQITVSPDGNMVACSSMPGGKYHIWNAMTGGCLDTNWFPDERRLLLFLSDRKILATPEYVRKGKTPKAEVWDVAAGKLETTCSLTAVKMVRGRAQDASECLSHEELVVRTSRGDTLAGVPIGLRSERVRTPVALLMDWEYILVNKDNAPLRARWRQDIFVRGKWVTQHGQNILWLPPDYRAVCSTLTGNLLVLGHASGRITRLEFASTRS